MDTVLHVINQPLFWFLSIIGSVVLSVLANLITPYVRGRIERLSHSRKHAAKKKQARLLGEVGMIDGTPEKLTQAKLDSIHALLLATYAILLCMVSFTLGLILAPFTNGLSNLVFLLFGTAFAWSSIEIIKVGQRKMYIARAYEKREKAKAEYSRNNPDKSGPIEVWNYMLEWDRKEFGVNYLDILTILGKNAQQGVVPHVAQGTPPGER